jgi:hypothetical protein
MMIRLTDADLDAVMTAARPIPPHRRKAFLQAVADEIAALGEQLGPGSVARAVRLVQRSFYDPPLDLGDDVPF